MNWFVWWWYFKLTRSSFKSRNFRKLITRELWWRQNFHQKLITELDWCEVEWKVLQLPKVTFRKRILHMPFILSIPSTACVFKKEGLWLTCEDYMQDSQHAGVRVLIFSWFDFLLHVLLITLDSSNLWCISKSMVKHQRKPDLKSDPR